MFEGGLQEMTNERRVDIIVVGAGAAGAVVARRMVDAGARVLLLEAGGPDSSEMIRDPKYALDLQGGSEDWAYVTLPQVHAGNRQLPWPRGKVLGGSSSINGMVWVRGCPADFDHWAYLGNSGWAYEDVLPLFRRIEDFDRGESDVHGVGGPIHVMTKWEPADIHRSFVAAAGELGIPFNDDPNGRDVFGAGFAQFSIRDGRRESSTLAYLAPVADAPNLEVVTFAHVRRLLFEGSRCVGVEWQREGNLERAHTTGEVVLSAGTVGSPQLLMLSGIGPAGELAAHGIETRVDLPGVGGNLHDHVRVSAIFTTARRVDESGEGIPPVQSYLFWRTDPRLIAPNVQPTCFGRAMYEEGMHGPPNGFTVGLLMNRPASRGRLRLASSDPEVAPLIDPATYECAADFETSVAGLRLIRELGRSQALAEWGTEERYPGPGVDDEGGLSDYLRQMTVAGFHPVGTCKMGVDSEAVVDPELRVRGVDGLRVADASIMPAVTSGNTYAPSVMIGERAADLLRA